MTTSTQAELAQLETMIGGGRVVIVSGAGLSTESGIPDYRGRNSAAARRYTPMTHQAFVADPIARRRYWARSHLGWGRFAQAQPNAGHLAVAQLERLGLVTATITQNVDGLHCAAGTRMVVDLHGRLDRVRCLGCQQVTGRAALAGRLAAVNQRWGAQVTHVNPDGDVDLPDRDLDGFTVVDCQRCGGVLMPDVVYFGGSVPAERINQCTELVDGAAMLLVLGTTLTVYSARRFVRRAGRSGTAVAIINDGATRCDDLAAVRIAAPLGATLTQLAGRLAQRGAGVGTSVRTGGR